jgi:methylated-DNA-[protein]-cysteine S-methyltransferase
MPQLSLHSPVGDLSLSEDAGKIVALDWGWGRDQEPTALLKEAVKQLNAYFDGKLTKFDLPLRPAGTSFHKEIWRQMVRIPYGKVRTYGDLAERLGASARAVGTGCGRNPIPIIIPCHRVVAAGHLGGYSGEGGRETKVALLRLENADIIGLKQAALEV